MKRKDEKARDVNKLNGSQLADLCSEFLAKMGHRDTLRAQNLMARDWFKDDLILEELDFSDEFEYFAYYQKLTKVPPVEVVREGMRDWLDCTYPARVDTIEKRLGLPSTLVSDPA
jgi:hypothetical protein